MKKKIFIVGLMMLSLVGCAGNIEQTAETSIQQSESAENTVDSTEETTEDVAIEESTDEGIGPNPDNGGLLIDRQEKEDGSIYVEVTTDAGLIVQTVEYNANTDKTIKYAIEYIDKGLVGIVYDYEGPGNLVEEFLEGNHENADASGLYNYDEGDEFDVDLDTVFEPTMEGLAPLYERASKIYDKYGVILLIGDKIFDYTEGAEACTDYNKISDAIDLIEECLECYPEGFFKEISNKWFNYTTCIQLVGDGGSEASYFGGSHYKVMQIDVNTYDSENSADEGAYFCHKIHWLMGFYISTTVVENAKEVSKPLTDREWNKYNPEGFKYATTNGVENSDAEFDYEKHGEYFVTNYLCYSANDDRANIFAEAMMHYQNYEAVEFSQYVDAKLTFFSECIKSYLVDIDWSEKPAWEYILNK